MGETITFHTGSFTYKIYKYILKKKAVISSEVAEEFKKTNLKKNHISSYMAQILKHDLIVKSKVRVQSSKRMCSRSFVYGINETEVKRKIQMLTQKVNKDNLLVGVKAKVFEILQNSSRGLTTGEIFYQLRDYPSMEDYKNWNYRITDRWNIFLKSQETRNILQRIQFNE